MKVRLIIALLSCCAVSAQMWMWAEEEVLVLDSARCVELALSGNAGMKLARVSLQAAQRELDGRNSIFMPTLAASAGLSGSTDVFSAEEAGGGRFSLTGGLSASLSLNPGFAASLRATETAYRIAAASFRGTEEETRAAVERGFALLLTLEKNLEILEENKNLAQKQYERVRRAQSLGLASELALLQAQLSVEKARQDLESSTAEYEASKRSFAVTLGLDPATEYRLSGEIEVRILDASDPSPYIAMLESHPDIVTALLKVESAELSLLEARGTLRGPKLSASAQYNLAEAAAAGGWSFSDTGSLSFSVSVPLDSWIPGSSGANTLAKAVDAVETARINLDSTRRQTILALLDPLADIKGQEATMRIAELQTSIALRSYELTEEGYNRGTVEQLDLEDARQELLEARQNLLSTRYAYLSALISLRSLLSADSLSELYEGQTK
jgi:multidrug efflux system outer membrane protein